MRAKTDVPNATERVVFGYAFAKAEMKGPLWRKHSPGEAASPSCCAIKREPADWAGEFREEERSIGGTPVQASNDSVVLA